MEYKDDNPNVNDNEDENENINLNDNDNGDEDEDYELCVYSAAPLSTLPPWKGGDKGG